MTSPDHISTTFLSQLFSVLPQVSAYSVACVTVSAFGRGLVDATKAEEVMSILRRLTKDNRQVSKTRTVALLDWVWV